MRKSIFAPLSKNVHSAPRQPVQTLILHSVQGGHRITLFYQKMKFALVPLKSVGDIRIGMSRAEVRAVMTEEPKAFLKTATSVRSIDGFHDLCVQVFYDPDDSVEYIELSRDPSIDPEFNGIHVLQIPASELVKQLGRDVDFDSDSEDDPTDVVFPDLSMSLWRPCGDDPDDPDSRYFRTVGIGRVGYYDNEKEVEQAAT